MNKMRLSLVLVSAGMLSATCTAGSVRVTPDGGKLEAALAAAVAAGGGEVVLEDGTYFLGHPLELGAKARDITIRAAEGARPVVSAGYVVKGWCEGGDGTWKARVPAGLKFSQFYVNGERRERPFLPRKGYWRIAGSAALGDEAMRTQKFLYPEGALDANWPDLTSVEIRVFHNWSNTRMTIASIDAAKREVTLAAKAAKACSDNALSSRFWFRAENVRAAFGEPGDWYLTNDGEIWYRPMPGERIGACEMIASRFEQALRIDGARNVRVTGVTFAHSDLSLKNGGRYCGQAGFFLPGTVHVTNARGVTFEDCAFLHTGAYGLVFAENCHACEARKCEFFDLGAGGARIGNGSFDKVHPPDASTCTIEDCLIAHGGRVDPVAAGIWVGNASSNRIAHCTIHDLYYSGISCGWDWGYANRRSHHNVIENNHIYDIGQRVLSDLAGIYTLAQQPGTVIRGNYVHDVTRAIYMGVGIYLDECSSYITVTDNLVRDVEVGAFLQYSTRSNLWERNTFITGDPKKIKGASALRFTQPKPCAMPSFFRKNDVLLEGGTFLSYEPKPEHVILSDNRVWHARQGRKFAGHAGFVLDEKLVGLAREKPGAGKRTPDRFTANLRARGGFGPAPGAADQLSCKPFAVDFEDGEIGKFHKGMMPYPLNTVGLEVTDETSFGGRKCYKVTDGMPSPSWGPHFIGTCNRTGGVVRVSMALRCEKGSSPHFEIRQFPYACQPFAPAFTVAPDGTVRGLGGKYVTKVEHGKWYRYELEFVIGETRPNSTYSVAVTDADGACTKVAGIGYDEGFEFMTWLGFTSGGAKDTVYYVDDVRVSDSE